MEDIKPVKMIPFEAYEFQFMKEAMMKLTAMYSQIAVNLDDIMGTKMPDNAKTEAMNIASIANQISNKLDIVINAMEESIEE